MRAIVYHCKNLRPSFEACFEEGQVVDLLSDISPFRPVATFDPPAPLDAESCLEKVYELTNTIRCPWWENTEIVKCGGARERSTSVGDVVVIEFDDGTEAAYGCAPFGWTKLAA